MIPDSYDGREHSFIKHKLLEAYLERLFMILGQVEYSICFIDCFAGPWGSHDDEFKDTSIGIAYQIMRKCRDGLKAKFGRDVQFRGLFIEKSDNAFQKLECYCDENTCDSIDLNCRHGEFYDLRDEILNWCGGTDFAFFYIDPTGWKNAIEIPTLWPLFQRPRSEFLINFMLSFIVRALPQEQHKEVIEAIFGDIPDTKNLNTEQKESYLLHKYRENAKSAITTIGGLPRSAYVKVEHPLQDRTKYDLVYLTRSPKGILVFMELSEKLNWTQRSLRAEIQQQYRIKKSGQLEIFSNGNLTVDRSECVDTELVKNYWLQQLSNECKQFGIAKFADMLEETGWFISDFQKAFKELVNEGLAENLDAKKNRPKHPIHFNENRGKGELLRKIF